MIDLEHWMYRNERWMYAGGHPNRIAGVLNRLWALVARIGLGRNRLVSLEVPGRRTGRSRSYPLIVADHAGERYLVAMLGEGAGWVANVRAAGGAAVLRHGVHERVVLREIAPALRAAILKRHLAVAPAARSFVPVHRDAPLAEFERIAGAYPVFRIEAPDPVPGESTRRAGRAARAAGTGRKGRRWRRWALGALAVLAVVVVASVAADVALSGEPPLAMPGAAHAPVGPLDGSWRAAAGSQAGFRIRQTVLGMSGDVVGRTQNVQGDVTIGGGRVVNAAFTVDLTSIRANGKPAPQLALSLRTSQFPSATVTLTQPIALGSAFTSGGTLTTTAPAELTMDGRSRPVTVTLSARRDGATIEAAGSIQVAFADWGIAGPAGFGPLGSLADRGEAEFLLVLDPR